MASNDDADIIQTDMIIIPLKNELRLKKMIGMKTKFVKLAVSRQQ
jgi:hypothetical protein